MATSIRREISIDGPAPTADPHTHTHTHAKTHSHTHRTIKKNSVKTEAANEASRHGNAGPVSVPSSTFDFVESMRTERSFKMKKN